MRPDVYWRIYRPDRIKPQLRGTLIFVLEIPATPGAPVLRHIFDPSGMDFPAQPRRGITRLLAQQRQGIVFDGDSKTANQELMKSNPEANKDCPGRPPPASTALSETPPPALPGSLRCVAALGSAQVAPRLVRRRLRFVGLDLLPKGSQVGLCQCLESALVHFSAPVRLRETSCQPLAPLFDSAELAGIARQIERDLFQILASE